jgi:aspergillopepsin I
MGVEAGQVFLAPITIGGQDFQVVIDTGSSDPWVVQPNFTCVDPNTGNIQGQADCYFGATYDSSQSSTYASIPNENFNITYSDGEKLTGDMAYERMTMAGITVPQQKFAVVDYAAWFGDGYSSGLVGFAYGTLTSAYAGNDPSQDQRGGTLMYNPLFVSMYNLSLIAPLFSIAIDRDPNNGGVLALGGIPNIPHSPSWVSAAIQSVGVFVGTTTLAYEFYTVYSDGFAVASTPNIQFNPYRNNNPRKRNLLANGTVIVDSGTSLVYAPNSVADAVAFAFQPPASYDSNSDAYFVSCTAKPPVFGVSIGKKIFFVNGADMILPANEGQCLSGVQPNNGGLAILGDVWMKNVLAVFDIGAEKMRFASRSSYGLTSTSVQAST